MNIEQHLRKYENVFRSLRKLSRSQDQVLWLWGAHVGLVHLYNAALHACGVTRAEASYATQRANVYIRPGAPAAFEVTSDADIQLDLLHVGLPPLKREPPGRLQDAAHILKNIEQHAMRFSRTTEDGRVSGFALLEDDVVNCAALLCDQLGMGPVEL